MTPLVSSFTRIFFDIILGEKIFIWASLCTFIGNYPLLEYFLFILELNSELWDQKLLFKEFVLFILAEYF